MTLVPFSPPFDHLVYARIVEACDLACEHCFIPANPKRMSLDDVAGLPALAAGFAAPGSRILVQWHGGEPTLVGAAWLDEAIARVEAGGGAYAWAHGIQTNLMSYGADWADLYRRRFASRVGVSWDPGIRLMRRDDRESNAEYERRFWPKLAALVADGIEPCLVATGTKVFFERFRNPMEFFDLLEAKGVVEGHVERVTETGTARRNWDRVGVTNAAWSRSMARFLRAYVIWREASPSRRLRLSPFDGLLSSAAALAAGTARRGAGCLSGACDTRFHTVDSGGYKRGCTALTSEVDNVRADRNAFLRIDDLENTRNERRIFACGQCEFRVICSSGCLAIDFDDGSGECSGGRGLLSAAVELSGRLMGEEQ